MSLVSNKTILHEEALKKEGFYLISAIDQTPVDGWLGISSHASIKLNVILLPR